MNFWRFLYPISLMLVLTLTSFNVVNAQLADSPWPMFQGNVKHTGLSPYFGPMNPALKWSFETGGQIGSSPTIGVDGKIYFGSYDDKLYSLNPDGSLNWTFETSGIQTEHAPAIDSSGNIYFGAGWESEGKFIALNSTGSLIWSYSTNYYFSSPAIDSNNNIYTGSADRYFYCFYPNGSIRWTYDTGGAEGGYTTAPVFNDDETVVYTGCFNDKFYALNATNGSLLWTYTTGDYIFGHPTVGADGTIYTGSADNKLYALNPNGTLNWTYETGDHVISSAALDSDGHIYFGSFDYNFYALYPNGTLKWSFTTGNCIEDSAAISVNGLVYFGSFDYNIYALDIDDGSLVWSFATDAAVMQSCPAIGEDGTLYIGSHDGKLYAITENYNAITLEEFSAKGEGDKVILTWATGTELNNAGFYIVKSENIDSGHALLNKEIIPAIGDAYSGHSYNYIDRDVKSGYVYYYWLVDVDIFGNLTIHGPAKAITVLKDILRARRAVTHDPTTHMQ